MTKRTKREDKIRANTSNVSLEDFEALINQYGGIKFGAKHPRAIIGNGVLTYKRANPVSTVYVELLLGMIDTLKKSRGGGE